MQIFRFVVERWNSLDVLTNALKSIMVPFSILEVGESINDCIACFMSGVRRSRRDRRYCGQVLLSKE